MWPHVTQLKIGQCSMTVFQDLLQNQTAEIYLTNIFQLCRVGLPVARIGMVEAKVAA